MLVVGPEFTNFEFPTRDTLFDIRASIPTIASTLPERLVAVFAGAISGIVEATIKQLAKHTVRPRIYYIGEFEESTGRLAADLKLLNPEGEYIFVNADLVTIRTVDVVCKNIKANEETLNLLFLTMGTGDSWWEYTAAVTAHSRACFLHHLLPLMEASSSFRRVVTIFYKTENDDIATSNLHGGRNSPLRGRPAAFMSLSLAIVTAPNVSFVNCFSNCLHFKKVPKVSGLKGVIEKRRYKPILEQGSCYLFFATSATYLGGMKGDVSADLLPAGTSRDVVTGVFSILLNSEAEGIMIRKTSLWGRLSTMGGSTGFPFWCAIVTGNGQILGSLKPQKDRDIYAKIVCNSDNDLRASLTLHINLSAPRWLRCEDDRFGIDINLYNTNVDILNSTVTNLHTSNTHGVSVLKLQFKKQGMTSTGLCNVLRFDNYKGADGHYESKSWIQSAVDSLRGTFSSDGTILVYVRDYEDVSFEEKFERLTARFQREHCEGLTIRRFYSTQYHSNTSGMPVIHYGKLSSFPRPEVRTFPTNTHTDALDFITRKGFGHIQMGEYAKAEIKAFNTSVHHSIQFMSIPSSGNIYYFGQLHQDSDATLKLKPGDIVYIQFGKELGTRCAWRGVVVPSPPWAFTWQVTLKVKRPYQKWVDGSTTNEKTPKYVTDIVPCGNGNQRTTHAMQAELQVAPLLEIRARFEHFDVTEKRLINALGMLATLKKPDSNRIPSYYCKDNNHLRRVQQRFLNHRRCIRYLQDIPVNNGLALGILTGRAGTGKTFFLSTIIGSLIIEDLKKPKQEQTLRILFVTPSNEPTDVGINRIFDECSKHSGLDRELIIRGHNISTEEAYVLAYATKNNRKKAAAKNGKTAPSSYAAPMDSLMPVSATESATHIRAADLTKPTRKFGVQGILGSNAIPNEAVALADGEVDMDLADTIVAKQLVAMINDSLDPGVSLVDDPRFKEVRQSIGFNILTTCGLIGPPNNYTDATRFGTLRNLLKKAMNPDEKLDDNEKSQLTSCVAEMREFIVENARVLGTTLINACCSSYYRSFEPTIIIADEMNRAYIAELAAVMVHYEAPTILLVGDTKQLKPVVAGKQPLWGFLKEIEMSALEYFESTYLPKAELTVQRRSRAGIMDHATMRYYRDVASNGPNADCDIFHPFTKPFLDVINSIIVDPNCKKNRFPAVYLNTKGSESTCDSTKSVFNVEFASLAVNIIEKSVLSGLSGALFGIITPYRAQIKIYTSALRQLHLAQPTAGYDKVIVGTTDTMEGNQAPIVIFDSGVTHRPGFTNDRGRCLVNLTRATDACVIIGQPGTLYRTRPEGSLWCDNVDTSVAAELTQLFWMAAEEGVVRNIGADHELYEHRFVKAKR
ncbi:hypothetical protein O988_01042 [Pseudogymnoascus sp. VKM F-3808]|nr:hypothetical protein O988_01042 [Pseudogymnoascus sp. VKM F-3808]